MAFTNSLRAAVRKRAHFRCCLCHALGVDIHHIVPSANGGPDTEENAAPLCQSCHSTYGGNPEKRSFIREARSCWFEICERRYASDADAMRAIAARLDDLPSKADLAEIRSVLSSLKDAVPQARAEPAKDSDESDEAALSRRRLALAEMAADLIPSIARDTRERLRNATPAEYAHALGRAEAALEIVGLVLPALFEFAVRYPDDQPSDSLRRLADLVEDGANASPAHTITTR